jgi:hypothetical protein
MNVELLQFYYSEPSLTRWGTIDHDGHTAESLFLNAPPRRYFFQLISWFSKSKPISVYRQNNPECSDKDPVTESANFYQTKTTGKWGGTCAALSFATNPFHGKSTPITYADIPIKNESCELFRRSFGVAHFYDKAS